MTCFSFWCAPFRVFAPIRDEAPTQAGQAILHRSGELRRMTSNSWLGAAFHARRLSRTFMPSTMAYRSGPPLWMTLPHTKPNSHWPRCSPAPQLRRKRPLSEFGLRVEIKKKKQRGGYARAASRQGLGFPNPNRGHASDTSDARTSGDRGDIAFPNRSAGCHRVF